MNPIGAYSTTDRTSYVLCTAGSYLNTAIQNCSVCALGTFSASNGSATCTTNTPGYYSSTDRKSQIACPAGTFLNGTSLLCSTCAPGTFTNLPGQTTCQANPTGQVSTPQTTLSSSLQLGGVSASSFGATQNATLTAAIASSLNVSASNVAITAVADAASGRRHLASGGQVTANFTVTCVGAATASAATTMLNTTANFSSALARTLSAATDPVLSTVSAASISVSAPQASTLYLASQPCPAGTFLNGATQSCDACAIGTVAPGEGTTTCTVCPARTVWLNASVSCAPCPNGAVTSPNNAAQCACGPGFYDTLFGASLDSPVCAPCPLGGVCRSGFIAADEGWWRESTVSAVLYKCRESNCLAEDVVGPLTPGGAVAGNATALLPPPLALNSSTEPTNCVPGNTGPLCSLCISGYAIQSGQCLPCNPGSAYALWSPGEKAGLILPIIVFSLLAIMFAFFQPLSPRLERTASRISDTTVAASEKAKAKVVGAVTSCFIRHRNDESAQPSAGEKIEEREARAASAGKEAPAAELEKNVEMQGAGPASLERRTARLPRASTFNSHWLGTDGEDDEAEGFAVGSVEEAPAEGAEESPGAEIRRPLASSSKGGREFAESASLPRSTRRLARKSVTAAAELVGENMSESDSDDDEDDVFGETGATLDMYYAAQRLLDKAQKYGKILINFYQIVSTFLRSLDVPWPHIFVSVMGKVNIINLNLVHLPKAACMSPNTTYYEEFQGYTLGLLFALLFIALFWALGVYVLSPLSLRGMNADEIKARTAKFSSTCLQRTLMLLYLVYPGVSVTIFGMFSCTQVGDAWYLNQDFSTKCYTRTWWRYVGGAFVWLVLVPVGVPVFFTRLLHYYKVPDMAALLEDNAWLIEAAEHTWRLGMPQPGGVDMQRLCVDTISDEHLAMLHGVLVCGADKEKAVDLLAGRAIPEAERLSRGSKEGNDGNEKSDGGKAPPSSKLRRVLTAVLMQVNAVRARIAALLRPEAHVKAEDIVGCGKGRSTRDVQLAHVLFWCRNAGVLSISPIAWTDDLGLPEGSDETEGEGAALTPLRVHRTGLRSRDIPQLLKRASVECGFLFAVYTTKCWYWESVELVRKLILTSILALISPGSAGQVVVGTLVAFFALLGNLRLRPFSEKSLNFVNAVAQMNLFFFLFVALLLKVNLDGDQSATFFTAIVSVMTIVPVLLPFTMQAYIKLGGFNREDTIDLKDAAAEGKFDE